MSIPFIDKVIFLDAVLLVILILDSPGYLVALEVLKGIGG